MAMRYDKELIIPNPLYKMINGIRRKSDFYDLCIAYCIFRMGGDDLLIDFTYELRKQGKLTSKQAFDLRAAIRKANKKFKITVKA